MSHIVPQPQAPLASNTQPSESDENIVTAAKGGGISFVGQIFGYGISFVFSVLVARLLGAERLGLYTLALSITGFVSGFAFLGLDGGLSRFIPIARKEKNKNEIWGLIQIGVGIPDVRPVAGHGAAEEGAAFFQHARKYIL